MRGCAYGGEIVSIPEYGIACLRANKVVFSLDGKTFFDFEKFMKVKMVVEFMDGWGIDGIGISSLTEESNVLIVHGHFSTKGIIAPLAWHDDLTTIYNRGIAAPQEMEG